MSERKAMIIRVDGVQYYSPDVEITYRPDGSAEVLPLVPWQVTR